MKRNSTSRRRFLLMSSLLGTGLFGAAACGTSEEPAATDPRRSAPGSPSRSPHGERAPQRDVKAVIDKATYKVDTDEPVVFLTIDDGVTRDDDMADILEEHGLKATLFLTDQYVRQDADFFRDLRDRTGSLIENHTLDHPDLTTLSAEEQHRQLVETSDRYQKEFGRRPTLVRPPYGEFNDDTLRAAEDAGARHVVHWTAVIDEGAIEYAAGDRLESGDIVLMHFREAFRADVECFVEEARRSGLRPALLQDYLT
jgi:peptidoglycan/xylan/chitin deacetylase (PgdA/CDA1 family)